MIPCPMFSLFSHLFDLGLQGNKSVPLYANMTQLKVTHFGQKEHH